MKIYNGTPHAVSIVANGVFCAPIRKWVVENGVEPEVVASIPSDGVLSAKIETIEGQFMDGVPILAMDDIPVFHKEIMGCDPLPDGYEVYIVSALYASAYRKVYGNTDRLYTVADPVYSEDGRTILGSRGICPAF